MNRAYNQKRIENQIAQNEAVLRDVVKAPIVMDEEQARLVSKGWQEMADMPPEEVEKFQKLTAEEIEKGWESTPVKSAIGHTHKALNTINEAIAGVLYKEKAIGQDSLKDEAARTLTVATGMTTGTEMGVDLGWTPAFRMINAQNAKILQLQDVHVAGMLWEQANFDSDIKYNKTGSTKKESMGPRYFAGGFSYYPREERFSLIGVNEVLESMKLGAANLTSRLAYRMIGKQPTNANVYNAANMDITTISATGDLDDYHADLINGISILNEAHVRMVEKAGHQGPDLQGKRLQQFDQAPLNIGPNDVILAYYNHRHYRFIESMMSLRPGQQGINFSVLKNWVFIQTAMLPPCGAFTVADAQEHDDYGLYETVTPTDPDNTIAVMGIIPGRRNIGANFRDNVVLTERANIKEAINIASKMEINFNKDDRQFAQVVLGTKDKL